MRIEGLGYRITEVPGYMMVRVEPSEHMAEGVVAVLDEGGDEGERTFSLPELDQLVGALSCALDLGQEMARQIEIINRPDV